MYLFRWYSGRIYKRTFEFSKTHSNFYIRQHKKNEPLACGSACFSSFVCHFQKSWDLALGPFKQIPMNLFIMYMAGNSISIFPIMMVGMMFLRPVKALLAIKSSKNVYYNYYNFFVVLFMVRMWVMVLQVVQQQRQLLTLTARTLVTNSYVSNRIHTVMNCLVSDFFENNDGLSWFPRFSLPSAPFQLHIQNFLFLNLSSSINRFWVPNQRMCTNWNFAKFLI